MEIEYEVVENDAELDKIVDKMLSVAKEDPVNWTEVNREVKEKMPREEIEKASRGELSSYRIEGLKRFSQFIAFAKKEERAYQVTFSITEDAGLLSVINSNHHPIAEEDAKRIVRSFSRYGRKQKAGNFVPHVLFLLFKMRH